MNTYSLSQLAGIIGEVVETEFDDTYWVRAEIASVSCRNGHGYLDLVEKGKDGLLAAKMRATCWANTYAMLEPYFKQETGISLQAGIEVLIEVSVEWHDVYGFSLNICNIDPSYTLGDIAKRRQQTLQKLQEEGILDMQQSLTLPTIVRRIAVISSDTAAGYEDFIHQCTMPGARCTMKTVLFPAVMQGDAAEGSIVAALQQIAEREEEFDVVVIIRGGGASIDMNCFDSYLLAATCAQFPLPIITGIGHTRDVSILDLVAYKALKTPTAVAAFFVDRLKDEQQRLSDWRRRLQETAKRQVILRQHVIELLRQRLLACDPERIYRQGYALVTKEGQPVTSIKQTKAGQSLVLHLMDGEVKVTVS